MLRPSGDGAPMDGAPMESGEMKAAPRTPSVVDAAPSGTTPAGRAPQQIARLQAFAAGSSAPEPGDTTGIGAAISDVRRAYDDAAAFEAVAGRPLDPSLSAGLLAALLRDAYATLGVPDSARAFARRLTP